MRWTINSAESCGMGKCQSKLHWITKISLRTRTLGVCTWWYPGSITSQFALKKLRLSSMSTSRQILRRVLRLFQICGWNSTGSHWSGINRLGFNLTHTSGSETTGKLKLSSYHGIWFSITKVARMMWWQDFLKMGGLSVSNISILTTSTLSKNPTF